MKLIHTALLTTVLLSAACATMQDSDEQTSDASETSETTPTEIDCNPVMPMPPEPTPSDFDWTPLAEQWCEQIDACGYNADGCVDNYLRSLTAEPVPTEEPPMTEPVANVEFSCESSDEYDADPGACAALEL